MSNLNPAVLQVVAQALADTVPDWAGRKFNPLLSWWQESTPEGQSTPEGHGSDIVLLGSDGRKVRFNPDQVKEIAADNVEKKAAPATACTSAAGTGGLIASPNATHGTVSPASSEEPPSSTRYSRVRRGRKPNPPVSPPSPVLHGGNAGK